MTPNNQTRAAAAAAELHDVFDITVGNSDRQFAQWVTPAQIEAIIARHFDESALRAAAADDPLKSAAYNCLIAFDRWQTEGGFIPKCMLSLAMDKLGHLLEQQDAALRAALSVKPSEGKK